MSKEEIIEHKALIHSINAEKIIAKVITESACISCQLKKICNISDLKEKDIEITRTIKNVNVEIGDKVTVYLARRLGLKAVGLSYVLPFFFMFILLVIMLQLTNNNELLSGVVALSILPVYYIILYLFNKKISKKYQFKIK